MTVIPSLTEHTVLRLHACIESHHCLLSYIEHLVLLTALRYSIVHAGRAPMAISTLLLVVRAFGSRDSRSSRSNCGCDIAAFSGFDQSCVPERQCLLKTRTRIGEA